MKILGEEYIQKQQHFFSKTGNLVQVRQKGNITTTRSSGNSSPARQNTFILINCK